jgi:hypothetical protein
MRKIILIILMTLPLGLMAQYWEMGVFMGGANYNGDFVDKGSILILKETNFTYGLLVRYNYTKRFNFKGSLYKGYISGSDDNASANYTKKFTRNLSFRSSIMDIGAKVEYNLMPYKSGHFKYKYAPFIFLGVSYLKFNPQAYYNGKWVNLQPLGTEGQGIPLYKDRAYSLSQIVIPFGIGWKQSLGRYINLGLEITANKTFTDYLDDCSTTYVATADLIKSHGQISANLSNRTGEVGERIEYTDKNIRGNPDNKDWYYFAGLTITYSILGNMCLGY